MRTQTLLPALVCCSSAATKLETPMLALNFNISTGAGLQTQPFFVHRFSICMCKVHSERNVHSYRLTSPASFPRFLHNKRHKQFTDEDKSRFPHCQSKLRRLFLSPGEQNFTRNCSTKPRGPSTATIKCFRKHLPHTRAAH